MPVGVPGDQIGSDAGIHALKNHPQQAPPVGPCLVEHQDCPHRRRDLWALGGSRNLQHAPGCEDPSIRYVSPNCVSPFAENRVPHHLGVGPEDYLDVGRDVHLGGGFA